MQLLLQYPHLCCCSQPFDMAQIYGHCLISKLLTLWYLWMQVESVTMTFPAMLVSYSICFCWPCSKYLCSRSCPSFSESWTQEVASSIRCPLASLWPSFKWCYWSQKMHVIAAVVESAEPFWWLQSLVRWDLQPLSLDPEIVEAWLGFLREARSFRKGSWLHLAGVRV